MIETEQYTLKCLWDEFFIQYFLDCNAKSMHINSLFTFYFFGRIFVALFHAEIIHWRHRMQIK